MPEPSSPFRVGLTADFLKADGTLAMGDIGLGLLDEEASIQRSFFPAFLTEISPEQASGQDALLVLAPRVTARTLEGAEQLAVVARFGVGYDNVDVEACTRHGVLLTITPDGVRRPVAVSVITLLLALTHRLIEKDRLTREGGWGRKLDYMGQGVTGRTLGVIGLGNIGCEVFRLAAPFEMRHLAFDPHVSPGSVPDVGLVDLDTLLAESDYVAVCCALTPETHHLLNARRLALMKPTAYLINVARGPIVDQAALTGALARRAIAGAGLDVFEQEPVDPADSLLQLDNVILAPHAICWTDECFLGNGRSACEAILDVAGGRVPRHVVNREVLESPKLRLAVGSPLLDTLGFKGAWGPL
jgi:D-3-phosphoglycerate dehydrogenase